MKVWGVGDGGNAETWPDFRLITHFLGDLGKVTSLSGSQFFFSTIKWKEQSLPYPLHRTIKWLGTCFINHIGSMNVRRVTSLLNPTCVTPSARSLSLEGYITHRAGTIQGEKMILCWLRGYFFPMQLNSFILRGRELVAAPLPYIFQFLAKSIALRSAQ